MNYPLRLIFHACGSKLNRPDFPRIEVHPASARHIAVYWQPGTVTFDHFTSNEIADGECLAYRDPLHARREECRQKLSPARRIYRPGGCVSVVKTRQRRIGQRHHRRPTSQPHQWQFWRVRSLGRREPGQADEHGGLRQVACHHLGFWPKRAEESAVAIDDFGAGKRAQTEFSSAACILNNSAASDSGQNRAHCRQATLAVRF